MMNKKSPTPRIQELLYTSPKSQAGRLVKILNEFRAGFEFLKQHPKSISIFGSERCGFKSDIYCQAEEFACELAQEGFAIITGGGHGIMEAANKGAARAMPTGRQAKKGKSIGLVIELPRGTHANRYVQESLSFHYFFVRKVMLAFASQAYVFFPGGFGTLNEFFEMAMLIQTGKTRSIPIVLVGKEYWQGILAWIEETVWRKNKAVSRGDMAIYTLVDTAQEALAFLKKKLKNGNTKRSNNITN